MIAFIFNSQRKIWLGILLLFWAATNVTFGQSLKIKAMFDSSAIVIGDQVKFRIEVDQPQNAKVIFPDFSGGLADKIQIVKDFPADTVKKENILKISKEFLVTSFDSGICEVAPIPFPFEMGGTKDTLVSASAFLMVNTVPADTAQDIRDIKPPLKAPLTLAEIWPYILIAIGVVLLGFAIWYFVKKGKKGEIFAPKKVVEPPHVVAIRQLDQLRTEKLWQHNQVKLYYTRLTEIIRVYLEQRFGINALEMTSDEIITSLKGLNLEDPGSIELLKPVFSSADLVKFAKYQPVPEENEIGLLNAYQFVNKTQSVSFTPLVAEGATAPVGNALQGGAPSVAPSQNETDGMKHKMRILGTILLLPKRIKFLYRLGILLFALGIMFYEAIPDLIFGLKRNSSPSLSIDELRLLPYGDIPRYFAISNSVVPSTSYVKITKKKRSGAESLKHIFYPVFSAGAGDSAKAYVVIKDSRVTESEIENGTYFTSAEFKVEGKFAGDRITQDVKKLFSESRIEIENDAIILERGSEPWPVLICIAYLVFALLLVAWLAFSFLPQHIVVQKFSN